MIAELNEYPVPTWLGSAAEPLDRLPLKDLLDGSVYYPACGFDGHPVQFLGGNFHSFVYVDYGVGREKIIDALTLFRGYDVLARRDVTASELAPGGWRPAPIPVGSLRPPEGLVEPPFGLWVIFERDAEHGPAHGPERFSLLYIGGDGLATFQAIYSGNGVAPAAIAVIQPGNGFGGNWTNFFDPAGPFAQAVMENPAGVPSLLLAGGMGEMDGYEMPCWPSHSESVWKRTAIVPDWAFKDTRSLKLWRRAEASIE